nr:hypothetical protein [Desulfobulbaceae bacterium]
MAENPTTLIVLKPLSYQGEQLLKDKWPSFLEAIRTSLQNSGFEDSGSSNELLLFSFNHPFAALNALTNCLASVKESYSATAAEGAMPISIILHLTQKDDLPTPYQNADAQLWEVLEPEKIYINRHLKSNWEILMAKKSLPPCTFKNHGEGLFLLECSGKLDIQAETLLSFRELPVQGGDLKECFYCGMKTHPPGSCPSKFLSMTMDGLGETGYLPFDQLNMLYKQVFQQQENLTNMLAAGITQAQLKKDQKLSIFVSYFDINRIFQLRFLWNMSFNLYTKWETVFKSEKLLLDNNNLQLGLDCIRVRQYGQAEALLLKENHHKSTKRFYATIGLAFLALERGRIADMGSFLDLATNMATQEKERIYVALLHSRYFELTNETWKARDILKNILSVKPDCLETRYRKIQLEVKGNFTEDAFIQLRSLMAGQRQFFMLVLMDPTLIPIQAKIENILSAQYFTLRNSSKTNLLLARDEIEDLKLWFDKKDSQMSVNIKTLENLQTRFERKSYFDVLDVEYQAKGLLAAGKTLRESKLNELYEKVAVTTTKWTGYYNFWKKYKYKSLFKKFEHQLLPLKKKLNKAHELAKKSSGSTYRAAVTGLNETRLALKELEPTFNRMHFVNFIVTSAFVFGKKLIISELAIAALGVVLSIVLGFVPDGTPISEFASVFTDKRFQQKAMLFAGIILAPIVALSWTMVCLSKE